MTRILITGAFGNIGTATLEELLDIGYKVTAFDLNNRRNRNTSRKYRKKIEIVWGDLRNRNDLVSVIRGKDAVIHVAGIIPPIADVHPKLTEQVNVGGTENIVSVIKEYSPNTKLIFTSSISVYGDRVRNPFIKKTDPFRPNLGDVYANSKIKAEKIIQESGIKYAIFRLAAIIPTTFTLDPLMFRYPLKTSFETCHPRDVGLALTHAVENEDILNGAYLIGGGEKCRKSYKEFLDDVLEILGLGRDLLPSEAFATKGAHCGYLDTDESQRKLKYQRFSLGDFYKSVKKRFRAIKFFIWMCKPAIRHYLLNKSEFYVKNQKK
ncbi:MAG: NAD(P)-dependent oxidoreductase [Candidatus Lokiarchaeota archaeon]|nr:NAD(P)-dependent oxidoreductase [Candidatus Lokiarchaeota archaeon]